MLPDSSQSLYSIAKLEEASRAIKQAVNELPALRRRLEKYKDANSKAREVYEDMQHQFNRLTNALDSTVLLLLEMDLPDLANYSIKLNQSIKSFKLMTPNYAKLCSVLNQFLAMLPTSQNEELKTTNATIIGRMMAKVKMGYYPTSLEHVAHIVRGIEYPEDITTNLFDPCCGCGLALRALSQGHNCLTYGVELDRYRAEEALTRLNRVGFGSYFRSRISNEAFHAMLLNPPYLSVMTESGNNTRNEKRFLVDSLSHLMYDGLLIYIIPYYRLTVDICRVLCDNFDDLTVWKFTDDEFKKYKQIAIMGVRVKRRNGSGLASELASLAFEPDKLRELPELPEHRYQLPARTKKVELFKGADFNVTELAEQLSRSTSFSKLFEKNKLDSTIKRPLLPVSLGQIGLIGGSGLINGIVDCDTPHIIKGRIVKKNTINKEENRNSRGELTSTTVYETRSNQMIFNLLTPQGFKALVDTTGSRTNTNNEFNATDENEREKDISDNPRIATIIDNSPKSQFSLGATVITKNARNVLTDDEINNALTRHISGDWGEVGQHDRKSNELAVYSGERIISAYTSLGGDKFWILTEADRSYTTVMLPEDY